MFVDDYLQVSTEGGERLLVGGIRVRILTEERLQGLTNGDFRNYRKRVHQLIDRANRYPNLTDPETIRAYDYLRNAVERETKRRAALVPVKLTAPQRTVLESLADLKSRGHYQGGSYNEVVERSLIAKGLAWRGTRKGFPVIEITDAGEAALKGL